MKITEELKNRIEEALDIAYLEIEEDAVYLGEDIGQEETLCRAKEAVADCLYYFDIPDGLDMTDEDEDFLSNYILENY